MIKNDSENLSILYQSDDNYISLTGISLTSLLENNKKFKTINIYIIDDNISQGNKLKLQKLCEAYKRNIYFINGAKVLSKIENYGLKKFHGGYTTYLKLFIFNTIKTDEEKILYIDGDTIIDNDLHELWNTNLKGYVFGAVCDVIIDKYKAVLNIPINDKYYNCGILLINLKEWKSQKCQKEIENKVKEIKFDYSYADQDIINLLFRNKIKTIDLKYNFNPGFFTYGVKESIKLYNLQDQSYYSFNNINESKANIAIYHCLAGMTGRPWEENSIHPYNEIFNKYKNSSLWKEIPLKNVNIFLMFKIQRILYFCLPSKLYLIFHKKALYIVCNKMLKKQ